MKNKILGDVTPKCEYCKFGKLAADGKSVLCPKKGILDKEECCKKFAYDPLKRVPQKAPELTEFKKEDFEL